MNKVFTTLTLGCKVNQYETEAMSELLKKAGYRELTEEDPFADIYLINTCTVTNLSDRKSRQMIRRAKKDNPNSVVVVVGCYSQVKPEEVGNLEEVDIVLGTKNRNKIVEYCEEFLKDRRPIVDVENANTYREFEDIHIDTQEDMTRAYLKVQDGCRQFCTYCIIPYARGPIRSRSIENSVKQGKVLAENGYQEIILTGIHIGSYGKDLKEGSLIELIEEMAKIPEIKRIRLSSIEPQSNDEDFMKRAVATKKLCDHFHLSLQNGSNEILKKMGRRYTREEYFETTQMIRSFMPDAGLTTDVIVGFPTEKEEHFLETMDFVKKVGFSRIHVFKYSPRAGTKAATMAEQVSGEKKIERSAKLMTLGDELARSFIEQQKGKELEVLFEKKEKDDFYYGYTTNYIRVKVSSDKDLKNNIKDVKIIGEGTEPVQATLV